MEAGRHVLTRDDVMEGVARDARRGAGRGDVPRRHQARHDPRADPMTRRRRPMIPGEIARTATTRSSSTPGARVVTLRGRERAATGRCRSARTTTSPRPTRRCSSTAPRPAGAASTSRPARRCASSPASTDDVDARAARRRRIVAGLRGERRRRLGRRRLRSIAATATGALYGPTDRRPHPARRHRPAHRGRPRTAASAATRSCSAAAR